MTTTEQITVATNARGEIVVTANDGFYKAPFVFTPDECRQLAAELWEAAKRAEPNP